MSKTTIFPPIGIAGAALVGKDTLCSAIIYQFNCNFNLEAKRYSIAGDTIRKDLKEMIFNKINVYIDMESPKIKENIRPLMVEYGRCMRNHTKGRYFIDILNKNKEFGRNYIPIIPDMRYSEYENDEVYWLKVEKKGLLIFLEREGIEPANKYEEKNNKILKKAADFILKVPTVLNTEDYFLKTDTEIEKIITTYRRDIFRPSNKS